MITANHCSKVAMLTKEAKEQARVISQGQHFFHEIFIAQLKAQILWCSVFIAQLTYIELKFSKI